MRFSLKSEQVSPVQLLLFKLELVGQRPADVPHSLTRHSGPPGEQLHLREEVVREVGVLRREEELRLTTGQFGEPHRVRVALVTWE